MFLKRVFSLTLAASLLGSGCFSVRLEKTAEPQPVGQLLVEQVAESKPTWKEISPTVSRWAQMVSPSSTARLTLYRFAFGSVQLDFEDATSTGSISAWHEKYPDALAILNGGYFDENQFPTGFLKTRGKHISARQYDFDKSGFLSAKPIPMLFEAKTEEELKDKESLLQSYPWLIEQGNAAVSSDSGKLARRSFVGLDSQQNFYLGIVDGGGMSLYELSQFLNKMDIDWTNVLNLDGGPSTGLSVSVGDWKELTDSWTSIPNVIVVRKK